MNLMELYYSILTEQNKATAEDCYQSVLQYVQEITDEDVKNACHFRELNRSKEVSYIDALGYSMAQNRHMKFLTGDKAFKGMENVEWVK